MPSAGNKARYKIHLVKLYNHAFDSALTKDHEFTNEELFAIKPHHVYAHFANMAYGVPSPSETDHPTQCRSSTLEFAKKAVSSFMPNRLLAWNAQVGTGNPTRSVEVNDLIKRIKKEEVRTGFFFCLNNYNNLLLLFVYIFNFIRLESRGREVIRGNHWKWTSSGS